jgi:deoxyribonuclease IV
MNIQNQPFGGHFSIRGGLSHAVDDALSIGCTAMQIFLHSNRQWHVKKLSQESIDQFKAAIAHSAIRSVVVHASYLINLGSPTAETRHKSLGLLTYELEACNRLGIPYLVLHPGSRGTSTVEQCLSLIAEGIDRAFTQAPGTPMLLLENTAGQGTVVGSTFEELRNLVQSIHNKKRVGLCFDTCHAFAAGYPFSQPHDYHRMWDTFDQLLGIEHLKVFHCNDSQKGLGSRVDRHATIGKGALGINAFKLLVNDHSFASLPKILEVPYTTPADALRVYKHDIGILKGLIGEPAR